MCPAFDSIVDLVWARAREVPDRVAFTWLKDGESDEVSITYRELHDRAARLGAWLRTLGVAGERVFIAHPSPLYTFVTYLGCQFAGSVAVIGIPARSRRALGAARAITADAAPVVGLTDRRSLADFAATCAPSIRWVAYEDAPELPAVGPSPPAALAHLQYTSGTTRSPRGVMISPSNFLWNLEAVHEVIGGVGDTTSVTWLPLYHDMGLLFTMYCLYNSSRGIMLSNYHFYQKPDRWLRAISRYRARHSAGPNFAFRRCAERLPPGGFDGLDLSCWQLAHCASEQNRKRALDEFVAAFEPYGFRREALSPCYGLAEFTAGVTLTLPWRGPQFRDIDLSSRCDEDESVPPRRAFSDVASCGPPSSDTRVVVVHPRTRQPLPDGAVGEVWVKGRSMAGGYWGRPDESQASFGNMLADGSGPFLATSDLGALIQGDLYIVARMGDVIRVRGEDYSAEAIEETAGRAYPAFVPGETAAFVVEVDGEDRLVVVQEVARASVHGLNRAAAVAAATAAVSAEHDLLPHAVVLLRPGGLKKTSSGKISRTACRDGFANGTLAMLADSLTSPVADPSPPAVSFCPLATADEIRDWIVGRLAARISLDHRTIDPYAHLSQLGVDSSVALSLTSELEGWLMTTLSPTLFWDHPSIDELARALVLVPGQEPRRDHANG